MTDLIDVLIDNDRLSRKKYGYLVDSALTQAPKGSAEMEQILPGLTNDRLYRKIYGYLVKVSGYQPYGFDMRTLRLTHPHIHAILKQLLA